jgi:CSLREA domain-containing protein
VAVALGLIFVGTACDPPPAHLVVNTTADGFDAAPGDGVCETATGNGVCTLRAAIAEGNALGAADLTVPAGTYLLTMADAGDGSVDLDVTGKLSINWLAPAAVTIGPSTTADGPAFDVAPGADFRIDGVEVSGFTSVGGNLVANHSLLFPPITSASPTAPVEVEPSGKAIISDSLVGGWSNHGAVYNQGHAELVYTTLQILATGSTPVLTTTAGATSGITATRLSALSSFHGAVVESSSAPACSGPVVSHGYNTALNSSCALSQPGDTEQGGNNAWVDRIPPGVLGCGVTAIDDQAGNPRPTDGNGDGVAACDTGAMEVPAAP